jgi:hypothetical protein
MDHIRVNITIHGRKSRLIVGRLTRRSLISRLRIGRNNTMKTCFLQSWDKKRLNKTTKPFVASALHWGLLVVVIVSGCQTGGSRKYLPLASKRDIRAAGADTLEIGIRNLPIQQYPLLAKFTRLQRIDLYDPSTSTASDDKLRAIADLQFTNVVDICLLNGRLVTDDGIRALSRIASLKMLQLEGTSITDAGCEVIAAQMKLTGVNVANCSKVTLKGLQRLAVSQTIWDFGFSADTLTTQEVIDLLNLA